MQDVEARIERMENQIDPPERDLMAKDILKTMIRMIVGLVCALLLTVTGFMCYIAYKDNQYNETIKQITAQYNEFINSFEFTSDTTDVSQNTTDGGNANYLGGNGDVNNGTTNSKETP